MWLRIKKWERKRNINWSCCVCIFLFSLSTFSMYDDDDNDNNKKYIPIILYLRTHNAHSPHTLNFFLCRSVCRFLRFHLVPTNQQREESGLLSPFFSSPLVCLILKTIFFHCASFLYHLLKKKNNYRLFSQPCVYIHKYHHMILLPLSFSLRAFVVLGCGNI